MYDTNTDILDQLNTGISSNALAKLHVSLKDSRVECIEQFNNENKKEKLNIMAKGKVSKNTPSNSNKSEIELIWKNLATGAIDLSYACVGYTLNGRPVLNQEDFVNLIAAYGFSVQSALIFINEYADQSISSNDSPIVMYSKNTADIMTDIKPLAKK